MATNYVTFQDGDLRVPTAGGDLDIDIPFSTSGVDTTQNGVLSLEVLVDGNPTLELDINGNTMYTQTFGADVQRVVQENFPLSLLGANNTLTVRVTGGGTVTASDFHVLYKT